MRCKTIFSIDLKIFTMYNNIIKHGGITMKKFIKLISVALLTVFTALCFTACVPSTAEKAEAKMKELGYSTTSITYVSADTFASTHILLDVSGYGVDNLTAGAKRLRLL